MKIGKDLNAPRTGGGNEDGERIQESLHLLMVCVCVEL